MPLVLLAGGTMSSDQWFDCGYQDQLDRFGLVAIDRLGHGESSRPVDPVEYDDRLIALDICAVLDELGVERAVVWGFSMGGKTAAVLAARHPDRVRALVCGSMPDPTDTDKGRERYLQAAQLFATGEGLRAFLEAAGVTDEGDLAAALARNPVPTALAAAMAGSAGYWPDHHEITAPTLWYLGAGEGGFSAGEQRLGEELGVEMHVTDSSNHAASFTETIQACGVVVPMLQRVCADTTR